MKMLSVVLFLYACGGNAVSTCEEVPVIREGCPNDGTGKCVCKPGLVEYYNTCAPDGGTICR